MSAIQSEDGAHSACFYLHSAIKSLGYPGAALLSFCLALLAYNVINAVKSARRPCTGRKQNVGLCRAITWPRTWRRPVTQWRSPAREKVDTAFRSPEPCRVGGHPGGRRPLRSAQSDSARMPAGPRNHDPNVTAEGSVTTSLRPVSRPNAENAKRLR